MTYSARAQAQAAPAIDVMDIVLVVARLFLASEFMTYGVRKFLHPENIYSLIAAHGLPGELVYLVIPWQVGFGWLCFLGFQTRLASAALFGFCIIAPSIFWLGSLENLTRDYATAGGFILLFLFGPGAISIDAKFGRDIFGDLTAPLWDKAARIDALVLFARMLMALPFLADAVKKALYLSSEQAVFQRAALPVEAVYGVIFVDVVFGLMLLLGLRVKLAAVVLICWSLIQAFTVHQIATFLELDKHVPFSTIAYNWFQRNGGALGIWFKDIEVVGALLLMILRGPGRLSLDGRATRR
jgi:putative oxidoreductase